MGFVSGEGDSVLKLYMWSCIFLIEWVSVYFLGKGCSFLKVFVI